MSCSCHLWMSRFVPGFVSEYVPVGQCEQRPRSLLVKSFMSCQTSVGFTFTVLLDIIHAFSWNCREVPALSQCAPNSLTNRTRTSFVANVCRCFVDLRFQRTGSATMLVAMAWGDNLGLVVVSRGQQAPPHLGAPFPLFDTVQVTTPRSPKWR